MAKPTADGGKAKASKTKAEKPKAPKTKAAKTEATSDQASTTPITLSPIAARLVGDQLRGLAYLSKKLALAIREKELATPFHPDEIKAMSDRFYELADQLRLSGDDGSNGG
ncbi:hypothetical protein [Falsiroseomonas ponticola]|uniref:hypothetical protein n=1 Tax=Falsiroseomonas ponticola TaxID=2786951 RepID=UPI0019321FB1|nr:hypothetical protein [Roseomonas ponticola]